MSPQSVYEQLDGAVEAMLLGIGGNGEPLDPSVTQLLGVADEVRCLPWPQFKQRLRIELQATAASLHSGDATSRARSMAVPRQPLRPAAQEQILPTLFGTGYGNYPIHRSSFMVSAVLHLVLGGIVLAAGIWIARHRQEVTQQVMYLIRTDQPLPYDGKGGGGGGNHDVMPASKGDLAMASDEPVAPPVIVLRKENPKLKAQQAVVRPPDIKMPQNVGDPLAAIFPPSNGAGANGGIGSGAGGGIGSGFGPGVGPGYGGGMGGGIYRVGGGVSPPLATYTPDPDYTEEARKSKHQGTVILWIVVGPDGRVWDIKLRRSLGMGLDEKAAEAVRKWRFQPGMKDGHPVAVQVNVEVNFRMY
ncbi:MAG TPA: energy transducer TonB [Terriglobales bacterium]|nr:energy transducer TonB [Terriglobales bacterium]